MLNQRLDELKRLTDLRLGEIIAIGAEAVLVRGEWFGYDIVVKYRYPKPYRVRELDDMLRRRRTALEAKLLATSRKLAVPVPTPLYVDLKECLIVMDYIKGIKLRDNLPSMALEKAAAIFKQLGIYVGRLHAGGIVHGDLTTSNVILTEYGKIFIIDFGLGGFSSELEEQGVDIHLMLRALESTHPVLASSLFKAFLKGYESVRGSEMRRRIEEKVREIRMRGRYVEERRISKRF